MDAFQEDDLRQLLAGGPPPCVSIYMPTHRGGSEQDPVRLRNNLAEIRATLVRMGKRSTEVDAFLAPIRQRIEDPVFWKQQGDGLAVFLTAGLLRTYRLPVSFPNEAVVNDRFLITPLLPLLDAEPRFYVLGLSQQGVRLLRCTGTTTAVIELNDVPQSLEQAHLAHEEGKPFSFFGRREAAGNAAAGIFHGHGVGLDDKKGELLQFCRQIDAGLRPRLQGEHAPLVLAAVDFLQAIYRQANTYPYLHAEGISGSPERFTDQELHEAARRLLTPGPAKAQQQALGQYRQMAGTGLTLEGLEDVVGAACEGRIETLFLPRGQRAWGVYHRELGRLERHAQPQPGDEELLNLAAIETLKHGRRVRVIDPDHLPEKDGPAAILCHPLAKHGKRP
jgi:hypothetical protein